MSATVSLHNTTQTTDGKRKSGVFEGFLHLTTTEEAEISALLRRRAVTRCQ